MVGRTGLLLIPALWGAVGTVSSGRQLEPPIASVRTDLVTLSVTVADRRGTLIAGLQQEHFTVFDNEEVQPIQFFSSEDLPATVGVIVDISGSVRGRREHVAAASAALTAIRQPLDAFFMLLFNEDVRSALPPGIAFTPDPDRFRALLSAAPAYGMSALYDALDRGLTHVERGAQDRRALIVLSDGGDNASERTLDAVIEHARASGAAIHSVMLSEPGNRDARPRVLRALARETGGRAFTPRRPQDVEAAFARIAREIRTGYTIGFAPVRTPVGGFRAVRVVVDAGDGRRLEARTRAGYYAEPAVD